MRHDLDVGASRARVRWPNGHTRLFAPEDVFVYDTLPDFIRNDARFEHHRSFLTDLRHPSKRGGGYWFWKPLLMRHILDQMKDGDVLAYFDMDDVVLQLSFASTLFQTMQQRDANLALVKTKYLHRIWTKRDIYQTYCPDSLDVETDPFLDHDAGFLIVRKSPAIVQFMDQWVEAVSNYHLVSDEPSNAPNIPGFKENRHDQSLLNALLECGTLQPTQGAIIPLCDELDAGNSSFPWTNRLRWQYCQPNLGWHTYLVLPNATAAAVELETTRMVRAQ